MKMQNQCIHTIRPNASDEKITVGYTIGGAEVDPDSEKCLAKRRGNRHWVKICSFGIEQGQLFNPHSPNFPQFSQQRVWAEFGKRQYEFRSVTPEAFNLYLNFLKDDSKESLLRLAQREI